VDRSAIRVLDEVIDIYRHRDDAGGLAELLAQRAEVVDDLAARRADSAEVAALLERIGDTAGAIAAWRRVLDIDDSDRQALAALVRLVRTTGDTAALISALSLSARFAGSPAEEHDLRTQIAQLEPDPGRVILAWQAVLDLEPSDAKAMTALELAYRNSKDWIAVSDLQTRRFGEARTTERKLEILAEMAELAERHRDAAGTR
jgi:tetratricopeptide (TPR) repeat protein